MGNYSGFDRGHFLDRTKRGVNPNSPTRIIIICSGGHHYPLTVNPTDTMQDIDRKFTARYFKPPKVAFRNAQENIKLAHPKLNYYSNTRVCWMPLEWDVSILEVDRLVLAYTAPDNPNMRNMYVF